MACCFSLFGMNTVFMSPCTTSGLAGTDLGMMLTIMLTILGVLLLDWREIAQSACFTQSYFIHTLAIVESSILPARAYGRFIVIRSPLRSAPFLPFPG